MSDEVVPLFHPRQHRWIDHFRSDGARIEGTTAIGRATVGVLGFNDQRRLDLRAELAARGEFP